MLEGIISSTGRKKENRTLQWWGGYEMGAGCSVKQKLIEKGRFDQ